MPYNEQFMRNRYHSRFKIVLIWRKGVHPMTTIKTKSYSRAVAKLAVHKNDDRISAVLLRVYWSHNCVKQLNEDIYDNVQDALNELIEQGWLLND